MASKWIAILLSILVAMAIAVLLWFMARASRSTTRRSSGIANAGWALLFLTSGRMPPPPPASQIEAELNGEKDRLGSRTIDPNDLGSDVRHGLNSLEKHRELEE